MPVNIGSSTLHFQILQSSHLNKDSMSDVSFLAHPPQHHHLQALLAHHIVSTVYQQRLSAMTKLRIFFYLILDQNGPLHTP